MTLQEKARKKLTTMSKVYIGVGHGGSDPGAVANGLQEKTVNLAISLACEAELERHGVTVKLSRSTDVKETVAEKVKECNAWGADLCVEIHNNAGGGKGHEVYRHRLGGKSLTLANNISKELLAIGQEAHGQPVKTRLMNNGMDYFGMIRDTKAPAVLVECAFLDSVDHKDIDTPAEQEKFGKAIARGVLKTLGITAKAETSTLYRVQVGAFRSKANAEGLQKELIKKGYTAIIKAESE